MGPVKSVVKGDAVHPRHGLLSALWEQGRKDQQAGLAQTDAALDQELHHVLQDHPLPGRNQPVRPRDAGKLHVRFGDLGLVQDGHPTGALVRLGRE